MVKGEGKGKGLIPLKAGTARAKRIASMGGSTKSLQKCYASKFRQMRKRGMSENDIIWFKARINDPKTNMIHMEEHLLKIKDDIDPDKYLSLMNQLHKTRFGEKHQIQNININIDMTLQDDERDDLLELLKENR